MIAAVNRWKLLQYGLIALPLSFAGLPIYLHAPDFYAVRMHIPIEVIGAALLFLRLFDALQDPIIGSVSDRLYRHRGSIIILGSIMLAGGMWMIFHPKSDFALFWLCLSVLICTTGFSVVSINVQALGGLWRVKAEDVTRVMGAREAIGLCGLLIASITPPILLKIYDSDTAFHYLTLGFLPLMASCCWVFSRWIKSVPISRPRRGLSLSFKDIFGEKKTRLFFGGYLLATIASSIPATLIIFYVRDYLQAESLLGMFLLLYFLSGAVAMPMWNAIARNFSTILSWWLSMILACLTFVWAFALSPGDIVGYSIVCIMSGVAVGANLALPSAIAADILAEKTHQRAASRYYSLMALLAKSSLALATGIALPLLGLSGYQPGEITSGYLMPIAYALVPCGIQVLAIGVLWRLVQFEKGKNDENLRKEISAAD